MKIIKFLILNIILVPFFYADGPSDKKTPIQNTNPAKTITTIPVVTKGSPANSIQQNSLNKTPSKPAVAKSAPRPAKVSTPDVSKPDKDQATLKEIVTSPAPSVPAKTDTIKPEPTCEVSQALHNKVCGYCPSDATYNKNTLKCECNDASDIIGHSTSTFENKTYFQCISCPANLVPNKDKTDCICEHFDTKKLDLHCNKYSLNTIKYNRKDGTYSCNDPEQVLGFDEKDDLLKCYTCPSDAKLDKDSHICICTKPNAKNPTQNIQYAPVVQDDKLVCNPNIIHPK